MRKKNGRGQLGTVLRFELGNFFSNRGYITITIVLVVILAVLMFLPRAAGAPAGAGVTDITELAQETGGSAVVSVEKEGVLLLRPSGDRGQAQAEALSAAFPEYDVQLTEQSDDGIRASLADGSATMAVLIDGDGLSWKYLVQDLPMYDSRGGRADEAVRMAYISAELEARGVDAAEAGEILNAQTSYETEILDKNQMSNYFYTYIMIFALYIVIMVYGQIVAGSVANEKTSRAMEVLITSARPKALMFGKIIGAGLAGLVQIGVIFGAALLFFRINRAYWGEGSPIASMFNIPPYLLVFLLVFFVLGYFLYASLYGAFGSTVSKAEDVQMATMPMTFGIAIMFIIVIVSVSSGSVDNPVIKVCSFIPFTSPMAMFARIAMAEVPAWQVAVSVGLLVVTVYAVCTLAARIYRMGVLLYGNAMRPGAVLKALRNAEKAK